jgi:hypothetical protein
MFASLEYAISAKAPEEQPCRGPRQAQALELPARAASLLHVPVPSVSACALRASTVPEPSSPDGSGRAGDDAQEAFRLEIHESRL